MSFALLDTSIDREYVMLTTTRLPRTYGQDPPMSVPDAAELLQAKLDQCFTLREQLDWLMHEMFHEQSEWEQYDLEAKAKALCGTDYDAFEAWRSAIQDKNEERYAALQQQRHEQQQPVHGSEQRMRRARLRHELKKMKTKKKQLVWLAVEADTEEGLWVWEDLEWAAKCIERNNEALVQWRNQCIARRRLRERQAALQAQWDNASVSDLDESDYEGGFGGGASRA